MNKAKNTARRWFLRSVRPTGPNRFLAVVGKDGKLMSVPTKRSITELAAINETFHHKPVETNQLPGSMRGSAWIIENRRLRSEGLPQKRAA